MPAAALYLARGVPRARAEATVARAHAARKSIAAALPVVFRNTALPLSRPLARPDVL